MHSNPLSLRRGLGRGFLLFFALLAIIGCDVHEWPHQEETVPLLLELEFTTTWDEQDHYYTRGTRGTKGIVTRGETRSGIESRALGEYDMRYIIDAYPLSENGEVSKVAAARFTYSKAVITDYDYRTEMVQLPAGRYRLMAWADFVVPGTTDHLHYDPTDFGGIIFHGTYTANTDYRDAFRGWQDVELESDINEQETRTVTIPMERPMAKYTFVSNDLKEFIEKEETRNRNNRNNRSATDTKDADTKDADTKSVDLNDYRVLFIYSGYLPNKYSLFSDRINGVTETEHIRYESKLTQLNDEEASMGFDYVVVNSGDASIEVTVGLFDAEGNQISMSDPIIVPLNRSYNTIMRGSFMMMEADGGVGIDPSFDGDYYYPIP